MKEFLALLWRTLDKWRMNVRGAKLKPLESFARVFRKCRDQIAALDGLRIDDPALDVSDTEAKLLALIDDLTISDNQARLVGATKALHHLLPELVVPMDRAYTGEFFGWNIARWQHSYPKLLREGLSYFVRVGRAKKLDRYVGSGWHSSRTKVIDNAIVGVGVYRKRVIHATIAVARERGDIE